MEQVIGMFLRIGIVRMPGLRVYWDQETRYGPVADIMSRNRFQLLLTVIYFIDKICLCLKTKRRQISCGKCPRLTKVRSNCLQVTGEEKNAINEMMVQFKGRYSGIKQYMRGKPHLWGFKIWCRTGVMILMYIKESVLEKDKFQNLEWLLMLY